ncbi:chitinase [Paenibacillus dendritiformis]|uniref:chitinase n=2 Tax=Paenibacillus dendritiformis TaxID=130049 RepID=UPI00143D9BEC|nr:chitinase [Paenibacillus dendritiformis]NKI21070.1 chitinase [Paenibacillus dendritiformis]NRF97533.1 chitinase [Paenibacillus dendritiformis]
MNNSAYPNSKKLLRCTLILTLASLLLVPPLGASSAACGTGGSIHAEHKANSEMSVGESRILSRQQIEVLWDGIDEDFSPDKAVDAVRSTLPEKEYEALFPMRLGSPEWHAFNKGKADYNPNQADYYSYRNLIDAVRLVANLKYKVSYREGNFAAQEIYRLEKKGKTETLIVRSADFNSPDNKEKPVITRIVDFGSFLNEGLEKDRKRDLAALLANLSHETGGGWDEAPGGMLRWGLYWNENIAGRTGQNKSDFVDPASSKEYPGFPGKKYYGRGPIMLSWNFNYGLMSAIIYGDKNVLLKNPEAIAADGKLGFATAILFWMTPQAPKPSAHDVMIGRWKPSQEEAAQGLTPPGFGVSIMVLNGLEANLDDTNGAIKRRAGHYRDITSRMGVDITGEKIDTLGMQPF